MAVLWVILGGFYGIGFGQILLLNILITGVSFILGDLYVLPKFENWGATIADFFLVLAIVWIYGTYVAPQLFPVFSVGALSALLIGVGEYFIHKYVDQIFFHQDDRTINKGDLHQRNRDLQTEFGEEITPPEDDSEK